MISVKTKCKTSFFQYRKKKLTTGNAKEQLRIMKSREKGHELSHVNSPQEVFLKYRKN